MDNGETYTNICKLNEYCIKVSAMWEIKYYPPLKPLIKEHFPYLPEHYQLQVCPQNFGDGPAKWYYAEYLDDLLNKAVIDLGLNTV